MSLISEAKLIGRVEEILRSTQDNSAKIRQTLRILAKFRSLQMQSYLIEAEGLQVLGGPFKGMTFLPASAEGCHIPKILGCYEADLHPHILAAAKRGYAAVINIGSAEGYYAVGLARLMPQAVVHAHDLNPDAQTACRNLAATNNVADRVVVGGEFKGEDFAAFAARRTLIFCDIEGGEKDLLDPDRFPALRRMDIIVELHDRAKLMMSEIVPRRFAESHEITMIKAGPREVELPDALRGLSHLDQLLAIWEWRTAPTPWAVMRAWEGIAPAPPAAVSTGR